MSQAPAKLHPENTIEPAGDGLWLERAGSGHGATIHSDALAPLAWVLHRLMMDRDLARPRRTSTRVIWTVFVPAIRLPEAETLLRAWSRPRLSVRADMAPANDDGGAR